VFHSLIVSHLPWPTNRYWDQAFALIGNLAKLGPGQWQTGVTRVRALATRRDFITSWKGADPDIPNLKQAKAEYAKLQSQFHFLRQSFSLTFSCCPT
jgi:hypothetical protein